MLLCCLVLIFLRHKHQVAIEKELENALKYNQEDKNHSLFLLRHNCHITLSKCKVCNLLI